MADQPTPTPARRDGYIDILLATALVIWVTMIMLILAFVTIPDKNMPIFAALASGGVLGTLGTLVGFRWGNAISSEKKTDTISAIANKAAE